MSLHSALARYGVYETICHFGSYQVYVIYKKKLFFSSNSFTADSFYALLQVN